MPKSIDQIPDPKRNQIWQESTKYSPGHGSLRKAIESIIFGVKMFLVVCKINMNINEIHIFKINNIHNFK